MSNTSKKKEVYLDNAASTPMDVRVKIEIAKATKLYGNPSSFNDAGRRAREALIRARLEIARFLGAKIDEIIFTSSGSEANNLAIMGLAQTASKDRNEIITTPIEHPSVVASIEQLSKFGYKIHYLKVGKNGVIDLQDLLNKINKKTLLVSIMYANNEIGTIEPIAKISKIINDFRNRLSTIDYRLSSHEKAPLFHVDACQATEYLDMNVNNLGIDFLTFNGSKIYGPRGSAVLYKRRGVILSPLVHGGNQEYGFRAGTENLPAIAGIARAVSLINKKESKRLREIQKYFFKRATENMPDMIINGPINNDRLPNNINISFSGINSESLLLELDKYGIRASSGSACTAHSVEPSHVLKAIGLSKKYIQGALRLSMGRQTKKSDMDFVLKILPKVVLDLKKRYNKN